MSAVVKTSGPPKKFQFVAGDVCLDFTNTMGGKRGLSAREYLNSYADFVSWCQQAGEALCIVLLRQQEAARYPRQDAGCRAAVEMARIA